ncbi:MAG: hypothetical protein AAF596_06165 [Planctomycetota bacterium]
MSCRAHETAAYLLAALYAFIALCGHSLHDHESCSGTTCVPKQIALCSCGHNHGVHAPTPRQAIRSSGWRSNPAVGINLDATRAEHDCTACALIAKLSVGQGKLVGLAFSERPTVTDRPSLPSTFCNPSLRLADARGPPIDRA